MDKTQEIICRFLITEYLIHNCYKETAHTFLEQSRKLDACHDLPTQLLDRNGNVCGASNGHRQDPITRSDRASSSYEHCIEWPLIDARKALYHAIVDGDIAQAFDIIDKHFPALLEQPIDDRSATSTSSSPPQYQYIVFRLRCQQFVEIIRSSNVVEAIKFAHTHLRSMHKMFQDMTNEVTSLIAYPDPHNSHTRHLLQEERRVELAEDVNRIVLELSNLPVVTSLQKINQQLATVQSELEQLKKTENQGSDKSIQDRVSM
ncbi:CTLH/CRA C-terminal to lish motif domain-containing protein [Radiomyces spectabilis]|uniref:CTLH/CRA C-terminal to lish motif domain-containing protein n=1 Tax=Radiomyces spectabilis TaxID=64574 RepID=UPI00221F465A|nr:CTLH/CRA C-terminal to lish motif domain-containing protein [Radiomyces spectabilis]KAI8379354.1 CTLH/CRA C-terminal to lish motif domain-containing protein [Radiomyces spectabilis]